MKIENPYSSLLPKRTAKPALLLLVGLLTAACGELPTKEEDPGPVFYPELPQRPRVQYLTTIRTERDIGGGQSKLMDFVAGVPRAVKEIRRPYDIEHRPGKLYVVDRERASVHILDLASGEFQELRDPRVGRFRIPSGIFVTPDGHAFIADKERGQVLAFNDKHRFVRAYGSEEQFDPVDVVVRGERVYVCDIRDEEIEILDRSSGVLLGKIGAQGYQQGEFRKPSHLTLDEQGRLYVTDVLNFRVQVFDEDGQFRRAFGGVGDAPGRMPRPKGVAVDKSEHLYVVDAAFELVQIFDARTGEVLLPFGKFGRGPGSTYLPQGIHIDYDNVEYFLKYVDRDFRPEYLIYVANQAGEEKINVYAFGEWFGPET